MANRALAAKWAAYLAGAFAFSLAVTYGCLHADAVLRRVLGHPKLKVI